MIRDRFNPYLGGDRGPRGVPLGPPAAARATRGAGRSGPPASLGFAPDAGALRGLGCG